MATQRTRVEVGDLGAPQDLRVPNFGGDTFVQPERPVINNDLERLSQSLSGFSSALSGFARANAATDKKALEDQAKEAATRFVAASTDKQLYDAVTTGQVPYASHPVAKAVVDSAMGTNIGNEFKANMTAQFGPGGSQSLLDANGNPLNIDEIVTGQVKGYLDRIPQGSPHATTTFAGGVEGVKQFLLQQQQQQIAARNGQMRDTAITTGFRNVLQGADLAGLPPEKVSERVRTAYGELQGVTHATWAELDDKLVGTLKLSLADNAATPQNARNVIAILDAPRKDAATGQDLGPLAQNPRFAQDATVLRSEATKVLAKDAEVQVRSQMAEQARAAFERGDGSFDAIQDVPFVNPYTKQAKVIPAQEIKDAAVVQQSQLTRANVARQLNGQPANVVNSQVFVSQANQFIPNGVINPEWQGYLRSSVKAAADATSLTDPDKAARLKQSANLYEALRTRSPAYVDAMLTKEERGFYENYHLLRKMGQGDDFALAGAAKVLEPENQQDPGVMARYQEVQSKVDNFTKTGGFSTWVGTFGGTTTGNLGQMRSEIIRRVGLLSRTQGMSVDKAIEAVSTDIKENVPVINGQFQFNRSPFLVKGREGVVQRQLDDVFAQHAPDLKSQGITSSEDLSVSFEGGHYRVVRAADGLPVAVRGPTPFVTFTDRMLRSTQQRMETEGNQKIAEDGKSKKTVREIQIDTGFDPRIPEFVPQ
ncbi:hypothetical protein [Roseixanthobacter pseudopolyaromaticivorans]|uniref:hypothetical protein n=1 Tax=Xanthobacteraceae TaxID=335928 RepID=UPI003729BDFA